LAANLESNQTAINEKLALLTEFVGDGVAWRFELAAPAAKMDKAVADNADWMVNCLFGTIVEFLDGINNSVRNTFTPELLASASASRTIVFEFVALDEMPRRFLGAMQGCLQGATNCISSAFLPTFLLAPQAGRASSSSNKAK
jgi:hypothetical protein